MPFPNRHVYYFRVELHDVRLYGVLDTVVISDEDVCCSVVFGTLVDVFVFSVMWYDDICY